MPLRGIMCSSLLLFPLLPSHFRTTYSTTPSLWHPVFYRTQSQPSNHGPLKSWADLSLSFLQLGQIICHRELTGEQVCAKKRQRQHDRRWACESQGPGHDGPRRHIPKIKGGKQLKSAQGGSEVEMGNTGPWVSQNSLWLNRKDWKSYIVSLTSTAEIQAASAMRFDQEDGYSLELTAPMMVERQNKYDCGLGVYVNDSSKHFLLKWPNRGALHWEEALGVSYEFHLRQNLSAFQGLKKKCQVVQCGYTAETRLVVYCE